MDACAICNLAQKVLLCGQCGSVAYCGPEHQRQHWKSHKRICRKISSVNQINKDFKSKLALDKKAVVENGNVGSNGMDAILTDVGDSRGHAENPKFMPQWVSQNSIALNPIDEFTKHDEEMVNSITTNMHQLGICVIDNFMDEEKGQLCLDDVKAICSKHAETFHAGQVIQPNSGQKKIRGDKIMWLDGTEKDAKNLSYLCQKMDMIISKCNSKLGSYHITQRTKAMLACYPGSGAAYRCHIDNPTADGRCITAIFYLNKDWDPKTMGGVLHIYPTSLKKIAKVEPKFNRLLLFYSDRRNPHEVMPTFAERFAITLWYFDDEERTKALETWAKKLPRR